MSDDMDMEDDPCSEEELIKAKPAKSILKKTSKYGQPSDEHTAARNRELAIHHAKIIQQQKDLAAIVLNSIEELIDFPLVTQDAQSPDPTDAKLVKSHLSLFKPTDFDSAVQERNIEDKCGYMLCPKDRKKQNTKAKYRIVTGRNVKVVEKEELEKWCSDDCGQRALYLRVQLSDTPVGERASKRDGGLKLYGEPVEQEPTAQLGVGQLTKGLDQLALERGDEKDSFRTKSVDIGLRERDTADDKPEAPTIIGSRDAHQQIEGFTPVTQGQWTMQMPVRARAGDYTDVE